MNHRETTPANDDQNLRDLAFPFSVLKPGGKPTHGYPFVVVTEGLIDFFEAPCVFCACEQIDVLDLLRHEFAPYVVDVWSDGLEKLGVLANDHQPEATLAATIGEVANLSDLPRCDRSKELDKLIDLGDHSRVTPPAKDFLT